MLNSLHHLELTGGPLRLSPMQIGTKVCITPVAKGTRHVLYPLSNGAQSLPVVGWQSEVDPAGQPLPGSEQSRMRNRDQSEGEKRAQSLTPAVPKFSGRSSQSERRQAEAKVAGLDSRPSREHFPMTNERRYAMEEDSSDDAAAAAAAYSVSDHGGVAQLGERRSCKPLVEGSIPSASTTEFVHPKTARERHPGKFMELGGKLVVEQTYPNAAVAQMVEHLGEDQGVGESKPPRGTASDELLLGSTVGNASGASGIRLFKSGPRGGVVAGPIESSPVTKVMEGGSRQLAAALELPDHLLIGKVATSFHRDDLWSRLNTQPSRA